MNGKSSAKFFSQLQAMNAGQRPAFRENGGEVSIQMGDVVVNNPQGTPAIGVNAARGVAKDIKREIRKANFKF